MNLFIFEARGFLPDALARALSGKDGTESLKYLRGLRDYVRHKLTLAYITVSSEDDAFLAEMGRRDISSASMGIPVWRSKSRRLVSSTQDGN